MKFFTFALFGLLAVAFSLTPELAMAQGVGGTLKTDITNMITGNIGTVVGLVIALFGLYMWLVQQATWGLMVILGGVCVTIFPGIFAGLQATVDSLDSVDKDESIIRSNSN